jgi:hypothetical protein
MTNPLWLHDPNSDLPSGLRQPSYRGYDIYFDYHNTHLVGGSVRTPQNQTFTCDFNDDYTGQSPPSETEFLKICQDKIDELIFLNTLIDIHLEKVALQIALAKTYAKVSTLVVANSSYLSQIPHDYSESVQLREHRIDLEADVESKSIEIGVFNLDELEADWLDIPDYWEYVEETYLSSTISIPLPSTPIPGEPTPTLTRIPGIPKGCLEINPDLVKPWDHKGQPLL